MKLKSKTTATLLIAIFMISTFAVAYAIEGTHLISTGAIGTANEDRIVIDMPVGFTLGDLETISWSEYLVAGYPPHVDVILDLDGGGYGAGDDALVFEYAYNSESHALTEAPMPYGAITGAWYQTFSDDGNGPAVITDTSMAWATKGAPGPLGGAFGEYNFFYCSLADWKAGVTYTATGEDEKTIDSDSIVLRLEFEIDNYVVDCEAYVKDIQVNGQSGTVSMTVFVEEAPIISISVDPTSVDFGSVAQGGSSAPQTVTITSASTVNIDLSASVTEVGSFYASSLHLGSADLAGWSGTIFVNGEPLSVYMYLDVPTDASTGLQSGTLVFWAQEASQ